MASIKDSLNELDSLTAVYEAKFRKTANEHLRDYVESITDAMPRFGRNSYVCPCCKSGTGTNGHYTPAFHLFRNQSGEMAFKCHSCGISGGIFTLAGLVNNAPSYEEQRKIIASFLGINLARRTSLENLGAIDAEAARPSSSEEARLREQTHNYILECREHVYETNFFADRGLSPDTVKRFNLGYDPKKHLAIIPFSSSYYVGRNTRVNPDTKAAFKHSNPKGLRRPVFNMTALRHPAVFVTEAPLDALSIVQSGGAAVALGGTSVAEFARILQVYRPETCFILTFDADGPGRRARTRFAEMLRERGVSFTIPQHPAFSNYKDANAVLMESPSFLKAAVEYETSRALATLAIDRKERAFHQDDLSAAKREASRSAASKNTARKQTVHARKPVQEAR